MKGSSDIRRFLSDLKKGRARELTAQCGRDRPYRELVLVCDSTRYGEDSVRACWTDTTRGRTAFFFLDVDELSAVLSLRIFTEFRIRKRHALSSVAGELDDSLESPPLDSCVENSSETRGTMQRRSWPSQEIKSILLDTCD